MNQEELEEYAEVLEKLLQERERLLAEIPPCPAHGACVPHAIEWVRAHLTTRPPVLGEGICEEPGCWNKAMSSESYCLDHYLDTQAMLAAYKRMTSTDCEE